MSLASSGLSWHYRTPAAPSREACVSQDSRHRVWRFVLALIGTLALLSLAQVARAQDPVEHARELYTAAQYEDALRVLDTLIGEPMPGPERVVAVQQHRAFCLLALGRTAEAEEAIAVVVGVDPLYAPGDDLSPRVRAAFADVRRRLLPEIAAREYDVAKAVFDRREFEEAIPQFRRILTMLEDPEMGGRLGDLRTLVTGFVDLSVAAHTLAAQTAAQPEVPQLEPGPDVADWPEVANTGDPGVVPAVTRRQDLPRPPAGVAQTSRRQGTLEVIIAADGTVESATMAASVHPVYDTQLLNATKQWKYEPATRHGEPVRFRKVIQVTLEPR